MAKIKKELLESPADALKLQIKKSRRSSITDLGDMHIIPHNYLDLILENAVKNYQTREERKHNILQRLQTHLPKVVATSLANNLMDELYSENNETDSDTNVPNNDSNGDSNDTNTNNNDNGWINGFSDLNNVTTTSYVPTNDLDISIEFSDENNDENNPDSNNIDSNNNE